MCRLLRAIVQRVRGVRSSAKRENISFLVHLLRGLTRVTYITNDSQPCHPIVSLTRNNTIRTISFLVHFLRGLTRVTYTTNDSQPCHPIVSLTRNNTIRTLRKYLTRASRSNTGTVQDMVETIHQNRSNRKTLLDMASKETMFSSTRS